MESCRSLLVKFPGIDLNGRALSRAVLHDGQHPNHFPGAHTITHEIHRPALIPPGRCGAGYHAAPAGDEFGQWREWNHDDGLDWQLLEYPPHQGLLSKQFAKVTCDIHFSKSSCEGVLSTGLAALDHARKILRSAERIFFSIATTVNAVVDPLFLRSGRDRGEQNLPGKPTICWNSDNAAESNFSSPVLL
jgi:hypothetical protein